ncbi:MAG: NADH-quinone oxidoreductase subunit A [Bifidobacteriaceae bacterium]|jgi:NADH-quinone oxidoreductase subunit A|nr:NADH-quinone oxidoreductase subunit A [Bifidobacteriaceae bacterium]
MEVAVLDSYVPILAMAAVAAVLALGGLGASWILGPHRRNRAKLDEYECGVEPSPQPRGGGRFPVRFYLVAMTFIVFDIEVVFLYPWAANFSALGLFAAIAMTAFLALVTVPYIYEWRRGALDWD